LRTYWPGPGRRYIEPFCGSACLFFDLQPENAVLGDLNEELLCAFRAIKADPYVVLECIRRFPTGKSGYYRVRAMRPAALPAADRAARFLYLNRYCFNGIYRTNMAGDFNVPYGPPKSGKPPDEAAVIGASAALQRTMLVHGDFERTLDHAQPGDFVYLDPPYYVDSRRVFREYGPGAFTLPDLRRLKTQLNRLHELRATFLVSYADCAEARDLFRPWGSRRVPTRRHIAGFSAHRRTAYELLACNRSAVLSEGC
jgi:DNA adenine methylase